MADEWWSAHATYKFVEASMGPHQAPRAIARRAFDRLLRTKADRLVRKKRDAPAESVDDTELPPLFWWAGGEVALTQNWVSGDFETWTNKEVQWKAYGVRFLGADVERIVPRSAIGPPTEPSGKSSLSALERKSLLKMIIAMAIKKYRYDTAAAKNTAIANIATHLRELDIPLDEDTIRKYLNEAKELLDDNASP